MKQITKFKRSIKKYYNTAQDTRGKHWYKNAYQYATMLAKQLEYPVHTVIGVMAALSPNNKWERNKLDAELFLLRPRLSTKVCTFMGQREKAMRIVHDNLSVEEIKTTLNGIKTANFFDNILNYKYSQNVTVDIWAFRSCNVEPKTKYIKDVTQAYKEVAQELQLVPHQLQAICWCSIRGSND